jgi:hypothetical protein
MNQRWKSFTLPRRFRNSFAQIRGFRKGFALTRRFLETFPFSSVILGIFVVIRRLWKLRRFDLTILYDFLSRSVILKRWS